KSPEIAIVPMASAAVRARTCPRTFISPPEGRWDGPSAGTLSLRRGTGEPSRVPRFSRGRPAPALKPPAPVCWIGKSPCRSLVRACSLGSMPDQNDHAHSHDAHQDEDRYDEEFWENRYRSQDAIWSGRPNHVLVAEVTDMTPGTALDVGCGEGGDAIW